MARKLKPCTLPQLHMIDQAEEALRQALELLRPEDEYNYGADCPATRKKIRSALKSIGGAKRHAWRRYRATQSGEV